MSVHALVIVMSVGKSSAISPEKMCEFSVFQPVMVPDLIGVTRGQTTSKVLPKTSIYKEKEAY